MQRICVLHMEQDCNLVVGDSAAELRSTDIAYPDIASRTYLQIHSISISQLWAIRVSDTIISGSTLRPRR